MTLSSIALANASPILKLNLALGTVALNQFALATVTDRKAKCNPSFESLGFKHPLNIALLYIPMAIVSFLIPAPPIVHFNMTLFILAMHQVSTSIFLDNGALFGPLSKIYNQNIKGIYAFLGEIMKTCGKGLGFVKYGINAFPFFDFVTLYAPLMSIPFLQAPIGFKLVAAVASYIFNMIAIEIREDLAVNPQRDFTTELRNVITSTPVRVLLWSMPLVTSPKLAIGAYSILGSLTFGNWLWKDFSGEKKSVSAIKGFLNQAVPPAIAIPFFLAVAMIYLAEVKAQKPILYRAVSNGPPSISVSTNSPFPPII